MSTKNNLRILNQAAFDEEPEADDLIRFPANEEIGDVNINDTNVNDVNVNEGNTDDVNDGISNDLNNFNTNDVNCDVNDGINGDKTDYNDDEDNDEVDDVEPEVKIPVSIFVTEDIPIREMANEKDCE